MSRVVVCGGGAVFFDAVRERFDARGIEVVPWRLEEEGEGLSQVMRGSAGVIVEVPWGALLESGEGSKVLGEGVAFVREVMDAARACGVVKVAWLFDASNMGSAQDEEGYCEPGAGDLRAQLGWVMEGELSRYMGGEGALPVVGLCEEGLDERDRARAARLMLERGKPGRRYRLSLGEKSERSSGELGW